MSWKKFDAELDLLDYIRRDTGEPLELPPYCLTADRAEEMQEESKAELEKLKEEYRRYRVRSEIQRKQKDAELRKMTETQMASAYPLKSYWHR